MSQLKRANEWVQYADDNWWNPATIIAPIKTNLHVQEIIKVLDDAYQAGNRDRIWKEIERVKKRYVAMGSFEAGVALNRSAQVALRLGYIAEAEELFYEARANITTGDQHRFAVLSWMLGCVDWLQPGRKQNDAISLWQQAINLFNRLARDSSTNISKMQWYQKQVKIMTRALKYAIENSELPDKRDILGISTYAGASTSYSTPGTGTPSPGSTPGSGTPPPYEPIENFFRLFVVYDEIPAGLAAPVSDKFTARHPVSPELDASDYIEVTRVLINEIEYLVRLLDPSRRRLNMVRDEHHFVMKVRGSSMNQSGIHDGDYVVLRSQATAENSDIVAAEILNVDTSRATLKRYNRRGDTITLSAESDDPEFEGKEWDFSLDAENSEDDGFFIRGVAVAVLKPAL
jgi:hypothetical protein